MFLKAYILAAMLFWSPLHKSMDEDPIERLTRYKSISSDIVEVAMDPNEKPIFQGKYGREKTALLLASIGHHESEFDKDVDLGFKRGDNGRSVCIMQIMTNTSLDYTDEYLLDDRKNCIRAALSIARYKCPGGIKKQLRAYASGSCKTRKDPDKEQKVAKASAGLVKNYLRWYYRYPIDKYVTNN